MQADGKGGNRDKENRPKVARSKGEKRAKRTSKAAAADQTIDLVVSNISIACWPVQHTWPWE